VAKQTVPRLPPRRLPNNTLRDATALRGWKLNGKLTTLLARARCSFSLRARKIDVDQPAKLTDFNATIRAERVWTIRCGQARQAIASGASVSPSMAMCLLHRRWLRGELPPSDLNRDAPLWRAKNQLALFGRPGAALGGSS